MKVEDVVIPSFLAFIISGGLALVGFGARHLWRGFASTRWPTVPGVVLKSGVFRSQWKSGGTTRTSDSYRARITVGYQVNGRHYTTGTIHFGQNLASNDPSDVALWALRYRTGKAVAVSYHPRDPSISAVRPGLHRDVLIWPGVGLGVTLFGISFLVLHLAKSAGLPLWGLGFRLFSVLFVLIGLGILAAGTLRLLFEHASGSWPVARGVMISSSGEFSVPAISNGGGTDSTRYYVDLGYRYEVAGREYFANLCRFGQRLWTQDVGRTKQAEELLARCRTGTEVRVAFCPSDPAVAVLEPGISSGVYWTLAAGALFALIPLPFFILSFRL